MAVYDEEKQELAGSHDDLGVHPERREAETADLEKQYRMPSAPDELAEREGLKQPLKDEKLGDEDSKKGSATGKALAAAELAAGVAGGGGLVSAAGDTLGKGFTGSGAPGKASGFVQGVKKRKGLLVGGGAGGTIVALIIFAIGAIVPYELVHIEKVVLKEVTKVTDHIENKAASAMLDKITCKLNPQCSKEDPAQRSQEASTAETEGEALTSETDSFDISSLAPELEAHGFQVTFDASGNLTGLIDPAGQDVIGGLSGEDNAALESNVFQYVDDTGILTEFRPLTVMNDGVSFQFWTGEPDDNVDQLLEQKIEQGASSEEYNQAAAEEDQPNTDLSGPSNQPIDPTASQSAQQEANGPLADALNQSEEILSKGGSVADAEAAAEGALNPAGALLGTSIATSLCNIDKTAVEASNSHVWKDVKMLDREGIDLFEVAPDMLKNGSKVTGEEVNATMKLLNGDSSAQPGSEASMPFSASAGWEHAIGESGGVAIDPGVIPSKKAGTNLVNNIESVMNVSGGTLTCKALQSRLGTVIQGAAGLVQIVGDIGSFGALQAIITAGGIAAQQVIQRVIIPEIISYFSPIGVLGRDAVQRTNNGVLGNDLAFNDYNRSFGSTPQTGSQANTVETAATNDQKAVAAQLPLSERLFAVDSPTSLIWQVMNHIPIGLQSTAASVTGYFTSFPASMMHLLADLFTPHSLVAAQSANDCQSQTGDIYCMTQYAFQDSEINKYDPLANEAYLFTTVGYGGKTMKRIDMLGNPNTYTYNPSGDSNNNDLLHCFVDSVEELAQNPDNAAAIKYCGTMGSFDYTGDNGVVVPTDSTVAAIYCQALVGNDSDPGCLAAMKRQVNDDVGHFRQYLLDTHVMKDYVSLTNDQ